MPRYIFRRINISISIYIKHDDETKIVLSKNGFLAMTNQVVRIRDMMIPSLQDGLSTVGGVKMRPIVHLYESGII